MSVAAVQSKQPRPTASGYHPLVVVLAAAAAGIVADRYGPLPVLAWWAVAILALVFWFAVWWKDRLHTAAVALLLAVAATAASWHHCRWRLFAEDELGLFARALHEPVAIEAVAIKSPRTLPNPPSDPLRFARFTDQVRLEIEVLAIRDGTDWRAVSGRAQLLVGGVLPDIEAGDRFRAFAQLALPPPAMNPGESDTAAYARAGRILGELRTNYAEAVSRLAPGRPWDLGRFLERVRMHGNRLFEQYLAPHHADLAGAVLLGIREQLTSEDFDPFQRTGTIHLLVIAGLHLGILAGAAMIVLRRLPVRRGWSLAAVALFTVAYMTLVDAEPPVVRATILVVTACGALYLGRPRSGFNVLAAAGLIVLAINPADLFRTGPQLSFLCVWGLMLLGPLSASSVSPTDPLNVFQPPTEGKGRRWMKRLTGLGRLARTILVPARTNDPLERLLAENRPWAVQALWWLGRVTRRLLLVGLALWAITAPLVMARFHLFNPVAIFLNTVVWVPMAAVLISGFILLVLGTLLPHAAPLFAVVCTVGLIVLDWLVRIGTSLPGGYFWVSGPADWWLIGFYGGLAFLAAFPRLRPPRRWCVALLAGWVAVGFTVSWLSTERHRLQCTFVSIGHGEAVVLELPNGQTVLYDAGRMSAPGSAARSISAFLWSRGIMHLDAVILSHGDVDHYNAMPLLLERFSVGVVYVSPVMFDRPNAALGTLQKAIQSAKAPIRELSSDPNIHLAVGPECTLKILHPPPHGIFGSADLERQQNANSILLSVECYGRRILLTGDLEPPGLDDVLQDDGLRCDMLLVPHHGGRSSRPADLAAQCTPSWAILSADHRYDLRAVEAIYAKAGSRVLHTADTGAVTARIDVKGMQVRTFLGAANRNGAKKTAGFFMPTE